MSRKLTLLLVVAGTVLLVPPLLFSHVRHSRSRSPRVHLFHDMDHQHRYEAQTVLPLFRDGRSNRPPPEGTVPLGHADEDDHFHRGQSDGGWATEFPERLTIDRPFLEHGRERFEVFCVPCHGWDGSGRGPVAVRGSENSASTWVNPTDLHTEGPEGPPRRPVGHIFNSITNGIRNMPPHEAQIPPEDRWAIVAYVRALQLSQSPSED